MIGKRNFNFVIIAILLSGFCAGAFGGINDGLVGYWEFEEGSGGTAYDSAGSNDGALVGVPDWVTGRVGDYALDFDGVGDYIELPDTIKTHLGWNYTISAWVKFAFFANLAKFCSTIACPAGYFTIIAFIILITIKAVLVTLIINFPFGNTISSFKKIYKIFWGNFEKKAKSGKFLRGYECTSLRSWAKTHL